MLSIPGGNCFSDQGNGSGNQSKKESINSFHFTPINISQDINSTFQTNNIDKNNPTYNKSFDLQNSLFSLFKKPETNFENISSFNISIPKVPKIKSLKKLKLNVNWLHLLL